MNTAKGSCGCFYPRFNVFYEIYSSFIELFYLAMAISGTFFITLGQLLISCCLLFLKDIKFKGFYFDKI